MYLQQFEFTILHRPGKENANTDALSQAHKVECNFIGVEISGEDDDGTPTTDDGTPTTQINDESDYNGDSEDDDDSTQASNSN